MKLVANAISISRTFLALSLLMLAPLSGVFYTVYIICGLSDIADGYIARKTNTTSKLGERLDSFSDIVMVFVVLIILFPILDIHVNYMICIGVVTVIRVISVIVVLLKYRTFGIIHTIANKVTGLLLFIYPLMLSFEWSDIIATILCIMGIVSASEELLIHIVSDELMLNRKSIIVLKREIR